MSGKPQGKGRDKQAPGRRSRDERYGGSIDIGGTRSNQGADWITNSVANDGHSERSAAPSEALDVDTEMADWFVGGVPRQEVKERAMHIAAQGQLGEFLVRYVGLFHI